MIGRALPGCRAVSDPFRFDHSDLSKKETEATCRDIPIARGKWKMWETLLLPNGASWRVSANLDGRSRIYPHQVRVLGSRDVILRCAVLTGGTRRACSKTVRWGSLSHARTQDQR
jgi:hypothetical protein